MKLVHNTGSDRVIDLVRPWFTAGRQIDIVTPSLSLFAFGEMLRELSALTQCRLLLPPADADHALLGTEADRAARNRLNAPWLAKQLVRWLHGKAEVRRAPGPIPQGAFVVRDGDARPLQVLMACLSEHIGRADVEPLGRAMVDWHKALAPAGDTTCVFRDSAFADDVAKTNLAAILEQNGITTVRSL